ncbi:MAG: ParB/RepB/Spo0J family partition protein [Pseudomonadota bacterium]
MAKKSDRKALGRGLSALLAGDTPADLASPRGKTPDPTTTDIPIDLIDSNPDQPRTTFRQHDLEELAASIRAHGIIQPVVLRPNPNRTGAYQIVAGERRWRAAQLAGVHAMPAVVREIDDQKMLELAIIENIQRVDLDPIEEARGYTQLMESFGYTQTELAEVVGKSRPHLANTVRLLNLPDHVLSLVKSGKLGAGHARAMINAADPIGLAEKAVLKGLTVRQVEDLARKVPAADRPRTSRSAPQKDADTRMMEGELSAAIGMRVFIEHGKDGGGEVRIRYQDLEALDRLCQALAN